MRIDMNIQGKVEVDLQGTLFIGDGALPQTLRLVCDKQRHLVCSPYSVTNLHRMAKFLGLKRHWFHRDHYDIPKSYVGSYIGAKDAPGLCKVVSSRDIIYIIRGWTPPWENR